MAAICLPPIKAHHFGVNSPDVVDPSIQILPWGAVSGAQTAAQADQRSRY
ncbi:hypothetical protein [Acetobacter sacchari]|nr:hypothetical protein [Acetobacter sacchari]